MSTAVRTTGTVEGHVDVIPMDPPCGAYVTLVSIRFEHMIGPTDGTTEPRKFTKFEAYWYLK
jgi:hypothetical protein